VEIKKLEKISKVLFFVAPCTNSILLYVISLDDRER
jgi:hypothetical protein